MEIRIEPHTLRRAAERGVRIEQIEDVLRTGAVAAGGRGPIRESYPFARFWQGSHYEHQRVKVIYTVEGHTAITITVCDRELRQMGGNRMRIEYAEAIDLLYIRLDEQPQQVMNQEIDGVVLDIGEGDRIVAENRMTRTPPSRFALKLAARTR